MVLPLASGRKWHCCLRSEAGRWVSGEKGRLTDIRLGFVVTNLFADCSNVMQLTAKKTAMDISTLYRGRNPLLFLIGNMPSLCSYGDSFHDGYGQE